MGHRRGNGGLAAAVTAVPGPESLKFAVVGDAPAMQAVLVNRISQEGEADAYNTVGLFETCIAPLKNAKQPKRFTF